VFAQTSKSLSQEPHVLHQQSRYLDSSPDRLTGSEHATKATSLFRKASCACGGGCPSCNSNSGSLRVSQPDEPAEIEADRMADQVMRSAMQ
jgi:hypothetical protein